MLVYNGSVKLLTTGFVGVCCCKMLQMRRNKFELTNFCRLNWWNWTGWLQWMETALIRFFPINLDPDLPPVKPQERRYVYRGKHSFRGGLEWAEDFYDMNVLGNKNPIHMAVMAVVGAEMAESWAIHAVEASPWHPISHGHMEGSSLSFAPSILGQDHKNPVQRQGGLHGFVEDATKASPCFTSTSGLLVSNRSSTSRCCIWIRIYLYHSLLA